MNAQPLLPNFFIIGAHKSGTTSLHDYVGQHPQVFMSPVKEPCFFAFLSRNGEPLPADTPFTRGLVYTWPDYLKLFEGAADAVAVGEASTAYLSSDQAPLAIRHHVPHAKIIAILRHPVDRAYSNFIMNRFHDVEPIGDFEQAISVEAERRRQGWPSGKFDYMQLGMYGSALARYYELFPDSQISVYKYDQLRDDPRGLLQDIFRFLGVALDPRIDLSKKLLVGKTRPRSRRLNRLVTGNSRTVSFLGSVIPDPLRTRIKRRIEAINETPRQLSPSRRRRLMARFGDDLLLLDQLTGKDFSRWMKE
jgi:hypothetical protein